MNISTLTWDKVSVSFKDNIKPEINYNCAIVRYDNDTDGLSITQSGIAAPFKHLLLAKPKLITINPWLMKWEACWWSAKLGDTDFAELIPVTVTCKF